VFSLDKQLEVGLLFSTFPRIKVLKIKVPQVKVSFVYGEDFMGFKLRNNNTDTCQRIILMQLSEPVYKNFTNHLQFTEKQAECYLKNSNTL